MYEQELDRLRGTRLQLDLQAHTLESANLNEETMQAMKMGSKALQVIHGKMYILSSFLLAERWLTILEIRTIDEVDKQISAVNEQMELANEIAEAIANPVASLDIDEVSRHSYPSTSRPHFLFNLMMSTYSYQPKAALKSELEDMEQQVLNERLAEADHVPMHLPAGSKVEDSTPSNSPLILSNPLSFFLTESRVPASTAAKDDEEAQLKELQAALAM